jgi:class 3 adenylate cyclase
VLHWSDAAGAYLDATGKPVPLPAEGARRVVTYLERRGRPMTALVHDPAVLKDPDLVETVLTAVRFVVENDRLRGQIQATAAVAAALPTGFVTLLMTDIERSTALVRQLEDRYGDLLEDIRGVLRASVSQARGREIDARADEFFAVFERAGDAVEAAVSIQRALGEQRGRDSLPVRVRVGIHSGRPTLTDAGYIGLAVHTVARVCAAAHGGQIVVSAATRAAVEGSAPTQVWFRSLGRYRLRGLAGAEALFQVEAEGLSVGFPPPRVRGSRRAVADARSRLRSGRRPRPVGGPNAATALQKRRK